MHAVLFLIVLLLVLLPAVFLLIRRHRQRYAREFLALKLAVRVVPLARHAVGDHGREERLDGAQHRDRERRREELAHLIERDRRVPPGRPERRGDRRDPGDLVPVDGGVEARAYRRHVERRDESVDEVRLIMSFGYDQVRLQLESANPSVSGGWEKIAGDPSTEEFPVPKDIRRLAVDATSLGRSDASTVSGKPLHSAACRRAGARELLGDVAPGAARGA